MDGGTVEAGSRPKHDECAEWHSIAPGDRSSDGIDPGQMLLVGNGVAAGTCQNEIGLQRLRIRDGVWRKSIICDLPRQRPGERRLLKRKQDLAGRSAMNRHAPADLDQHAQATA